MRKRLITLFLVLCCVAVLQADTQTRQPTGDSATWDEWGSTEATKWEAVDDTIGANDGDTTYISTSAVGLYQSFTFPVFSVSGTVNFVRVHAIVRHVGAGGSIRLDWVNEDTDFTLDGAVQNTTTSYVEYTETFTTNGQAGDTPWTVNQVNSDGGTAERLMEMLIRNEADIESRCTQIWLVVDYTPAGGAAPKQVLLMGVGR